jgi:hypothetical protein
MLTVFDGGILRSIRAIHFVIGSRNFAPEAERQN